MFTDNKNLEKIAEGIWIYRNFISKEKVQEINSIMEKYKDNADLPHSQGGTKYDEMLLDWYQDKTSPNIPELYPVWKQISELLYPEYAIHPQLYLIVTREDDEMFVHSDSPGEGMEENLSAEDRWNTCCVLHYGAIVYFGDYTGGEVFYVHYNENGEFEGNRTPYIEGRELKLQTKPGDLVIHGALSNHAHGVHNIKSGYRYAFSNFVLPSEKNPGTFPLYNTKENDERWNSGPTEWLTPINFKWEPSETLKEELKTDKAKKVNYRG